MKKLQDVTNKRFFEIITQANGHPLQKMDILNLVSCAYRLSANEAEKLGFDAVARAEVERANKIYKALHDLGYYADIENSLR